MKNKIRNQIIITLTFFCTLSLSIYVLYLDYETMELGRKIEVKVVKKYCDVRRNKSMVVEFKQKEYTIFISENVCYKLKVGSKLSYYHNTKFDYLFVDWKDNLFWTYYIIGFFILFTSANLSNNYPPCSAKFVTSLLKNKRKKHKRKVKKKIPHVHRSL